MLEATSPVTTALRAVVTTGPAVASLVVPPTLIAGAIRLSHQGTRHVSESRREVALLPSKDFEPSPSELMGWAAGLLPTRHHGFQLGRPASAVRLILRHVPPGRLGMFLSAPDRVMALVEQALPDGVIAVPSDGLVESATDRPRYVARADLTLSQPDSNPLAVISLRDFDPKGPWSSVMGGCGGDEAAELILDLMPVSPASTRSWARRLARQPEGVQGGGSARLSDLAGRAQTSMSGIKVGMAAGGLSLGKPTRTGSPPRPPVPKPGPGAKEGVRKSLGPMFHVRILARASTTAGPDRAAHLVHALMAPLSAWGATSGDGRGNHWRARGVSLGPWFLGMDLPILRSGFDRSYSTGVFHGWKGRPRVSADELGGLLVPPTKNCPGDNIVRDLGVPKGLKPLSPSVFPVGIPEGLTTPMGVPMAQMFFGYSAGKTRAGKTSNALAQMVWMARHGHGVAFMDPHHDAMAMGLPYTAQSDLERLWLIDLTQPWETCRVPGYNIIDARGLTDEQAHRRLSAVMAAFQAGTGWNVQSTARSMAFAADASAFLIELSRLMPPDGPVPTIFQIPTVLGNETWRKELLPYLPKGIQDFWKNDYSQKSRGEEQPVVRFFRALQRVVPVAAMFGAQTSTLDLRQVIDSAPILFFVPPRTGEDQQDQLATKIFVRGLMQAILSRADVPAERRAAECPDLWLWGDEVQTWDGPDLPRILQESGKFGLRAVLMNQDPSALSPATLAALGVNASILTSHALDGAASAKAITSRWGEGVEPDDLIRLPRFHFYGSVTVNGVRTKPFRLTGLQPSDLYDADPTITEERVLASDRYLSGADVVAGLKDLDERILAAVTAGGRPKRRGPVRVVVDEP